jgi:hypothetical protein
MTKCPKDLFNLAPTPAEAGIQAFSLRAMDYSRFFGNDIEESLSRVKVIRILEFI